jgi:hypothetical protein
MRAGARAFCTAGTILLLAACTDPPPRTAPSPSISAPAASGLACESLDTLAVGTTIVIGPPPASSFQPPMMDIAAHPFALGNGAVTTSGTATTENTGRAGGSGTEIRVNNLVVSVSRGFGQVLHSARIAFGEYGGNINVSVNNAAANVGNFAALHNKVLGGVAVTVLSGGLGNDKGVVEFHGFMPDQNSGLGQLAVGGQELWIDDICFAP